MKIDVPGMSQTKCKVMVVDDHPIVREGIAQFLGLQENLQVCCSVDSMARALAASDACRHDLAIVDLSLKDEPGLDLVRALRARYPKLLILVLSMHDEVLFAVRALQAGANGYLMKQEGTQNILEAVRELLAGNCYLSRAMHERVAQGLFAPEKARKSAVAALSDKEFAILQMIGMGMGTREISERLSRSVKTIEAHRANIKDKLGLKTGQELLRYAMQMLDG